MKKHSKSPVTGLSLCKIENTTSARVPFGTGSKVTCGNCRCHPEFVDQKPVRKADRTGAVHLYNGTVAWCGSTRNAEVITRAIADATCGRCLYERRHCFDPPAARRLAPQMNWRRRAAAKGWTS